MEQAPEQVQVASAKYKGKYGGGWIPDTHDKSKDPKARARLGAVYNAAQQLPEESSMEKYVDLVRDQKDTSECTGFAFARVIHTRLIIVGTPIPWPSTQCLYTIGRKETDRGPLSDDGAMPSAVVKGAIEWGVASSYVWGFDPEKVNEEPNLEELENASGCKITGWWRVDEEGQARVQRVCQAIAAGFPVAVGTMVDQPMEDYDGAPTSIVTAPDPLQLLGGHMMAIVGYRTVVGKDGIARKQFRVCNSWGVAWGDKGLFWADEEWLMSQYMSDIYLCEAVAMHQGAFSQPKS